MEHVIPALFNGDAEGVLARATECAEERLPQTLCIFKTT